MDTYNFFPIGFISSCYKEKFGIPRQSGLVQSAPAHLILNDNFNEESIRGLEGFSHLWVSFIFHANNKKNAWKPMVKPPRLGGNEKVGVFASRSPFRPNPLGLSIIKIDQIQLPNKQRKNIIISLLGSDLLDGTPVVDIKPYLPYVDSIPDAQGGFATNKPDNEQFVIEFSSLAKQQIIKVDQYLNQNVHKIIKDILKQDPRPSYKIRRIDDKIYSMKLFDFDLKWQYCENNKITVLSLTV